MWGEPMRRFLLLTGATLIAVLGAPLAGAADKSPPEAKKALSDAIQAYRDNDCPKASSLVAPIIAAPASAAPLPNTIVCRPRESLQRVHPSIAAASARRPPSGPAR